MAQLRVDGALVGPVAWQGLGGWLAGWDSTSSQRTLSVSDLAVGAAALAPGSHTVELVVTGVATVRPASTDRMSVWDDDAVLVWID